MIGDKCYSEILQVIEISKVNQDPNDISGFLRTSSSVFLPGKEDEITSLGWQRRSLRLTSTGD
jgi:hypothetical protein